ncbi:copper amine oxidase N-terminal domain-containing protein [Aneurinibacillus sp. Ricciae_BoGa-3]|uniref:copper amine oxidase N-terminal domain-containing protein n=1 Tax=Aneurinibacillus sp. Ricciae_BoGa-3 TaxID=3022697 RepID=UPI00234144FF|nr:copper amine oxidase N-terminal domain-containing protein [Aneurinibacillus sp. Ricciae_BoGa-3]WCK53797.1 copper amine oxidase N-terminal domain-containing protein [Aneurinibacillus sp. Ricciae_BoGa-3]
MKKNFVTGLVTASLLVSSSTVFAHEQKHEKEHEQSRSASYVKYTGLTNALSHVKNERAKQVIRKNLEKHEERETTDDDIIVSPPTTTSDTVTVTPTTSTGDTISINTPIVISNEIKVTINGKTLTFAQKPIVINGTTLVPLREIFENLGVKVNWDAKTNTVKAEKGARNVLLKVGAPTASVNGKAIKLLQKAQVINQRTMVPVRFISESLGANVNWNPAVRTVVITQKF